MKKHPFLITTTTTLLSINLLFGQCNNFDIDLGPPCYEEQDCSDNLVTLCCHVDVQYHDGVASWQYGHMINGEVEMTSEIINTDEMNTVNHCVQIPCTDVVQFYINSWTEEDGGGIQCAQFRTFPQAAVPVEFGEFQALNKSNGVELQWTTLSEINNDRFEIQKRNALQEFETIGEINAIGNSDQEQFYSFLDRKTTSGISYYRINQIDYDGHSSYSDIVSVYTNRDHVDLNFYPNPVQDEIFFNEKVDQIKVIDGSGKVLKIFSQGPYQTINLNSLQAGVYFLEMSSEGQTTMVKRMLKI